MTNNPTIDGVSLKLIQDAVNGNRQESREAIRELREFLRNQIDAPAVERQEHKPSQVPVLRAMAANYRNGHSWDLLDGEAVSKAADEITAQVSTIARLEARIAELESGRGEPVAWIDPICLERMSRQPSRNFVVSGVEKPTYSVPLFTAPPAPVAVVLPERMYSLLPGADYWNACLDATAALNGVKS